MESPICAIERTIGCGIIIGNGTDRTNRNEHHNGTDGR